MQLAFLRFLAVLAALAPAVPALATVDPPTPKKEEVRPVIAAVLDNVAIGTACDSHIWKVQTPACASFKYHVIGYQQATLIIQYTRVAATKVFLRCDTSIEGTPPWATHQNGDNLGSTIPMYDWGPEWDVSSTPAALATAVWRVNIRLNDPWLRCRFYSTAGGTSDKVKVWLILGSP